jgi:integrase
MVRFQQLTGCRPVEVCLLRPCDVDVSADVWLYRPESHKTEHHDRHRLIAIGPRAQAVLRPYLLRDKTSYCFVPVESERQRREAMHAKRKTPLSCGNVPGSNRKRKRLRFPGSRYTTDSYRRAIARGCLLANRQREEKEQKDLLPKWHPNQLRHSVATTVRRTFGLEASQVVLGHSKADVTQVYAERDWRLAAEVMRKIG